MLAEGFGRGGYARSGLPPARRCGPRVSVGPSESISATTACPGIYVKALRRIGARPRRNDCSNRLEFRTVKPWEY